MLFIFLMIKSHCCFYLTVLLLLLLSSFPCAMYVEFSIDLDVPSQLMNVDAQLIEDTSVQITWDQPSNNPPVTSVAVNCMPPSPNCGTCTIRGLASNTTYNFTVTPNNNCGPGSPSSASATTNYTGKFTLVYYYCYVHIM